MSLYVPEQPKGGVDLINQTVSGLLSRPDSMLNAMADIHPDRLAAAAPHLVYFISLEGVASGQMLAQVELINWRYIVLSDERPLFAVDLVIDPTEGALEVANVNQGPQVE